jgi:DNA-binding Lrp family transcriptional regulator
MALVDFYTHQDDRLVIMPTAYVLINCDLNSETKIIEELKDLPELVEISKVVGSYDMVAKVTAHTVEKFKEVIDLRIRGTEEIRSTLTLIFMEANDKLEERIKNNKP